ncbi:hypothetical protein [Streptomyces sp. NBC_01361]|uniref:hypothetical protein n=1 Tax=Streptomyces sp. NBC_01361 TaxID=2903838 RepID=UPI002E34CD31|nr:hypothetical protein [Streptomyces sp. NBC_01361]
MLVLVEHAAETVASAYAKTLDLYWFERFGDGVERRGSLECAVGAVMVVVLLVLAERSPGVGFVPEQGAIEEFTAQAANSAFHD